MAIFSFKFCGKSFHENKQPMQDISSGGTHPALEPLVKCRFLCGTTCTNVGLYINLNTSL